METRAERKATALNAAMSAREVAAKHLELEAKWSIQSATDVADADAFHQEVLADLFL
jgi:hypothetical protein